MVFECTGDNYPPVFQRRGLEFCLKYSRLLHPVQFSIRKAFKRHYTKSRSHRFSRLAFPEEDYTVREAAAGADRAHG